MAIPAYYAADGTLTDGEAWVAIQSTTIVGTETSVAPFTSTDDGQVGDFSQYMDLVLIMYGVGGSGALKLFINGDTTANIYEMQQLYGDGSSVTALSGDEAYNYSMWMKASGGTSFSCAIHQFFDINSGKYKSMLLQFADDHDGSGYVGMIASTYKSQAPITEIDLVDHNGGILIDGSRYDLFGVLPRMVA
tara:strand:+ start:1857 stop:2429 length:573 start_codon:yes stop_codon:yes gene_type:complete